MTAGDTFEEVGRLVIRPSVARRALFKRIEGNCDRTHCLGRNGEQRVEVYPLLGYGHEEDTGDMLKTP